MTSNVNAGPRTAVFGAFLGLLVLLAAILLVAARHEDPGPSIVTVVGGPDPGDSGPMTPLDRGTEVTRQPVGPFVLMAERDEGPLLLCVISSRVLRIHLSFDSPDGLVNVALTDDGSILSATAESPGCHARVQFLQYGEGGDDRHLHAAMRLGLAHLASACGKRLDNPERYQQLLAGTEADFPQAIRAMRDSVAVMFSGRTKRCKALAKDDRHDWPPPPCRMD